jgi:hypothetical protein
MPENSRVIFAMSLGLHPTTQDIAAERMGVGYSSYLNVVVVLRSTHHCSCFQGGALGQLSCPERWKTHGLMPVCQSSEV